MATIPGTEIQKRLWEEKRYVLKAGDTAHLTLPLIVPAHTCFDGEDKQKSIVQGLFSGMGVVMGRRPCSYTPQSGCVTIDPGNWPSTGGVRLKDMWIQAPKGTEWDLGPYPGWQAVRRLRVRFKAYLHYGFGGPHWDNGPWQSRLMGIQDSRQGLTYSPHPCPFVLSWLGGRILFAVGTSDGGVWSFYIDGDHRNPELDVEFDLNLDNGFATGSYNGHPAVVDGHMPPGLKLRRNHLWQFGINRFGKPGMWGGDEPSDFTLLKAEVKCDHHVAMSTDGTFEGGPPPELFPGGPRGPFVSGVVPFAYGNLTHNYKSILFLLTQGNADGVSDNGAWSRVSNMHINTHGMVPSISLGIAQGRVDIQDIQFFGGNRAVSMDPLGTFYKGPNIQRCEFNYHYDRCLFLMRAAGFIVEDCFFLYPRNAGGTFWGGSGLIRDCMGAPGGWDSMGNPYPEIPFEKYGGSHTFERAWFDYEPGPGMRIPAAFVRVFPSDCGEPNWPTVTRLIDCAYVSPVVDSPAIQLMPADNGYVGVVENDRERQLDTCRDIVQGTNNSDAVVMTRPTLKMTKVRGVPVSVMIDPNGPGVP